MKSDPWKIETSWKESLQKSLLGFLMAFTVMTLLLALIGYFLPVEHDSHNTFMGEGGLSYQTLLQIAVFCLAISFVRLVFMSNLLFKKMLLLWRVPLMIATMIALGICFIFAFGWFPLNSWEGWLGFLSGLLASGGVLLLVMWRKVRRESREYDELLQQYKQNKNTK